MRNNITRENPPIEIFEGTLVRLHKKLNGVDSLNAEKVAEKTGDSDVLNPPIVIDFATVTSIQKDYKHGGTVVMDAKTACIVMEPLDEVLNAWCEVKRNLDRIQE